MGKLQVACAKIGMYETNTYILTDDENMEAVVIDPAGSAKELANYLKQGGYTLKYILLTHGHNDHTDGLPELKKIYGPGKLKVFAARPEHEVLMNPDYSYSYMSGDSYTTRADKLLEDREIIDVPAGHPCQCIYTPGHTVGGCCYYYEKEGWLFSGDTLFAGSIGRTDFPTGDYEALMRSVNEVVMAFPDETIVFPGHGPETDIGYERKTNPFVREPFLFFIYNFKKAQHFRSMIERVVLSLICSIIESPEGIWYS